MSEPDYLPALLERLDRLPSQEQLSALEESVKAHPGDPRPMLLMAAEFAQQGQLQKAEEMYSAALVCAPGLAIARFQLGLLQFTSGRVASAMLTWAPLDLLAEHESLRLFKQAFGKLVEEDLQAAEQLLTRGMSANTINEPLNRDMALVLERIRTAQRTGDDETRHEHFLVSVYKGST